MNSIQQQDKRDILIISAHNDAHVPFVTKYLDKKRLLVIDPLDIIKGKSLDYVFSKGTLQVFYNGRKIVPRSIWYRRPTKPEDIVERLPIPTEDIPYAVSALRQHIQALEVVFPEAFWISEVPAIRHASKKPLQLMTAVAVGFNVPETLFASNRLCARAFVEKHERCVAKIDTYAYPPRKLSFTKIITAKDNLSYDGLRYDPYTFQALIIPKAELRVTVVGDQTFTSSVAGDETDGVTSSFRDWRYAHANDSFKAQTYVLPPKIAKQCVALTRRLGLAYGAIDLIVDQKDKIWFLEINPNGQWAFVEETNLRRIGHAIANLLSDPPSHRDTAHI